MLEIVANSLISKPSCRQESFKRIAMGFAACSALVETIIRWDTGTLDEIVVPLAGCIVSVIVFGTAAWSEKFSMSLGPAFT